MKLPPPAQRVALVLGALVAALGVSVLAGWMLEMPALRIAPAGGSPIRPNAAFGFLVAGVAIAAIAVAPAARAARAAVLLATLTLFAIGLLSLAQEFFAFDLAIDQWLHPGPPPTFRAPHPGRISPPTAFCFVLTAGALAALLAAPTAARAQIVTALGAALMLVGGLAIFGHGLDVALGVRFLNFSRIATLSACGFLLTAGGLLALARRDRQFVWALGARTSIAFAVGALTMVAMVAASYDLTLDLQHEAARIGDSQAMLEKVATFDGELIDIAGSRRSYVILGDESALARDADSPERLRRALAAMRELTAPDSAQRRRVDDLEPRIAAWFASANAVTEARRHEGFSAAQSLLASGESSARLATIRQSLEAIRVAEYAQRDARGARLAAISARTFLLLPIGIFLGLTIVSLGIFLLNAVISAHRQAEKSLQDERMRLAGLIDSAMDAIVTINDAQRITLFNPAAERMFEVASDAMMGEPLARLLPAASRESHAAQVTSFGLTGVSSRRMGALGGVAGVRASGEVFPLEAAISQVDVDGRKYYTAILRDVTERQRAEEGLRESERRFRQLAENIREVFWLTDTAKQEMLYVSPAYDEIWGRASSELYTKPMDWIDAIHPDDRARVTATMHEKQARGDYFEQYRIVRPDGTIRWISDRAFPVHDESGNVTRIAGIAEDITEARNASERLRESERRFADLLGNIELASIMLDTAGRITYCNDYLLRLAGREREEVLGASWHDVFVPPGDTGRRELHAATLFATPGARHHTADIVTRSGAVRTMRWNNSVLRSEAGEVIGIASIGEDVTERIRAGEVQTRLAAIVESTDDAILSTDLDGVIRTWNAGARRMFGYAAAEVVGESIMRLLPDDRLDEEQRILGAIRRGETVSHLETSRRRKDGGLVEVMVTASPVRDASGAVVGASKILHDVTSQNQLEQQLRQSQKMEAIGQLTGGVAHDFNNLLGVILGNLDLVEERIGADPTALEFMHAARRAAMRGADLTTSLLGFSRRQRLQPTPMPLNESIRNLVRMATRVLGPEITIATSLDSDLPPVLVDAAGLDNALLNLAVNARDAMGGAGGTLRIATARAQLEPSYPSVQIDELPAGEYARITVSDTGCGMSAETAKRAIEPFFTTKGRGKGTGLGLSMVYGFVRQSGGTLQIYSEEGRGTTVSMYLPFAQQPAASAGAEPPTTVATPAGPPPEATLVAMVVDDEADLLAVAATFLEGMSFLRVLRASDGPGALAALDGVPKLDVLVTDIVMPGGMNGVELAQRVRARYPGVRIVLSSGYPSDALADKSGLAADGPLLNKPYQRREFVATVRRILEETPEVATVARTRGARE